jgi:hypothetical protein
VVPELFSLLDIAFVDLVVPLVIVQITITTEPSGSSRRNKSLSRALVSPKDAPQKPDTSLHQIKQMNIEDGLVCAQRLEQRSSGCSRSVWRYVCKREDMLPGGASYFALSRRGPEVSRKSSRLGITVSDTGDQKSGIETHGRNKNSCNSRHHEKKLPKLLS